MASSMAEADPLARRDGATDAELLNAVFRFKTQRPSATQSASLCRRLRDALVSCVDAIVLNDQDGSDDDRRAPLDAFTPQERAWLHRGRKQLQDEPSRAAVGDVWTFQWFPAYGGVLQAERVGVHTVALRVLALDQWAWTRHFLPSGECVDSAVPQGHVVVSCGQLPVTSLGDVHAKIRDAMAAAAQITGTARNAAGSSAAVGHQKTPQFLVATVRTVVDAIETSTTTQTRRMPRGGMTDVGLHTGGAARDTCWPLVCTALRQALPKHSVLFDKVLLAFHGMLLDREVPVDGKHHFENASADAFWRTVDQCFEMLERVVDRATQLDQEDYDAKGVLTKCEAWRQRVDTAVAEWSQAQADKYTFPAQLPDSDTPIYPTLAAPDQTPFGARKANGLHGSPHAVASSSSQYVLLEQEPTSAVDVLVFLESIEPHQGAKKLFGARLVEKFYFRHSTSLTEPVARDALPQFAPEPLLDMMTWYQEHALKPQPHSDDTRRVEQQSVFAVLSWVAFCLAHRHCCDAFADVQQHKIALDWHGLEVCVLRELQCRTALRHVVQYIHDWNAQAEGEALFDLSHQEGTLAFARRMGQTLPVYQDLYLEVVSRFRVVCESQWAAIAARKASLELVRQEIRSYSVALNDMKHNLKAAEEALRWEWLSRHPRGKPPRYLSNWQTQVFSEDIYRLTELIRQKTAFRDELIQMPEFAVSPLPANQEEALQILFLLAPPPPIENLAELCWRARRALTPPSSGIIEAAPSETCSLTHLEGIVGELPSAERAQCFSVFPAPIEVPTEFGPMSIDDVSGAEAYTYSCVWFPNGSETTVMWPAEERQEGAWVNPFQVDAADSRRIFTPRVAAEASPHGAGDGCQRWEWALTYPGDNGPDRGNMTYAQERMSSDRDGNDQAASVFTSVGALRSYPFQQLRRLFACVAADSLQWSDEIAKAVLRQALYQVGALQVTESVQHSVTTALMWHQDLSDEPCVQQFSATLARLIDKVKLSPRRWDCVPMLSEIAAFLYQFDSSVKPLLLILAQTTRTWAHEIREEWQRDAVSDKDRSELRLRECILYGSAVLCLNHLVEEAPVEDEVVELCELLVSFHHAKLFALDSKSATVVSLVSQIECMMANRVVPIITTINASPRKQHLLTQLARVVLPVVPDRVEWRQIQDGRSGGVSCCFVGVDDTTGSSFGINLFTGAVTSKGGHPTSLPPSIRSLPLYEQLFNGRDFEVTYAGGVYETTRHSGLSCQNRFRASEDSSNLSVEEVSSEYTLQICASEWCDQLGQVLPARLGKLYSAWYWMARQTVLLRGIRASDKAVYYVMQFDVNGTTRCYEVPRYDRLLNYATLMKKLREYPVLVVGGPVVLAVLNKFEDPQYIHTLRQQKPPHALEISLPRFGLRFERQPNGRLSSITHRGYVLSNTQQLHGQMLRFRQYMLLEKQDSRAERRRLVVPMGSVRSNPDTGLVEIECSGDASAAISFLSIDWHARLEMFKPETMEARLQLAAIYAASSNRVPWSDLRMTGGEAALQMLRGCSPSRPFSPTAAEHLVGIATRFSFGTPVLAVMAGVLLEKPRRLAFLFEEQPQEHPVVDFSDALDEYRHQHGSRQLAERVPVRQWLSRAELWDLLGSAEAADLVHARSPARPRHQGYVVDAWEDSAVATFVQECENELAALREQPRSLILSTDGSTTPPFPLSPHGSNTMSTSMLEDLQTSWSTFHRHHKHSVTITPGDLVRGGAQRLLDAVRAKRHDLKLCLEHELRQASSSVRDQLARTVSRGLDFTLADVMRSTVDEEFLRDVMPFSLEDDRMNWKDACLGLLKLCVLEDKLERIVAADADTAILEELGTIRRSWKPAEHPYWLVFEVEGGLQIRHEQYVIAKHLLENPGSICQLNMGRGKTRVILPMLFLYHSYAVRSAPRDGELVRAHFLSPLLSETRELMWSVLTSSVLSLPFVELPFNRSCTLTHQDICMIRHVLNEAKRSGTVVMVAPEHRLSLELERVELLNRHGEDDDMNLIAEALDEILHPDNYIDIFDESDALLHHGYHLVYAVGASIALDGGATRWLTAEALLRVLVSTQSRRVRQTLQRYPDAWSTQAEYQERFGAGSSGGIYSGFRLHTATSQGAVGEKMRSELRIALIEDLIDRPPFELEWLRLFSSNTGGVRASLVRLLIHASVDANEAMWRMPPGILHVKHQVLALRGFLAFNVLETCLEKRYRVEFGHPPAGSRRKQIAIPFQAADLPAERSEFSHPDVGIALTLLAFYHSGLSDAQLRRAFEVLVSLDESESIRYYAEWFSSVALQLQGPEERAMLSSLEHISTDNAHQFAVLCRTYRFAIQVINFYVNFCVFPGDTRQFPHRLSRSAWDLARGSRIIGFSGTKDTHYLLPHGVAQREPDEPALQGTDGKMIQLLLDSTRGYEPLMGEEQHLKHQPSSAVTACWQSLLLLAVRKQSHALIDTGALLAGVSNHDAARFLVAQPDFAFQGVTYYDTRPQFDGWVVLEKDRDLLHHHHSSSLHERDTFVIFDEARARGSDMKQSPHAVALLTLGPGITKDKLMQGAGRMRLLGANQQTLWLTSTQDVFKSITSQAGNKSTSAADAVAVLNWVVDNTQRQCTLGLLEWAQSGIQFYTKNADPVHELQDDDWTLEGQYSAAQTQRLIADIIQSKLAKRSDALNYNGMGADLGVGAIRSHGEVFGRQDAVFVTSFDEECEREVQIEEEQQQVSSAVHRTVAPCVEQAWKWCALLDARSVEALRAQDEIGVDIISLQDAARAWFLPLECGDVAWEASKIFATANFWSTVTTVEDDDHPTEEPGSAFVWTSCPREVHAMVVFADTSVLLLSEFEESAVLEMLHTTHASDSTGEGGRRGCFGLVHLPFVVDALNRTEPPLVPCASWRVPLREIPLAIGWNKGQSHTVAKHLSLSLLAVLTCCLLNGDTELFVARHAAAAEAALRTLLAPVRHREETLQSFVTLRGYAGRWKRSSLHAVARRMDLEAAMAPPPSPLATKRRARRG